VTPAKFQCPNCGQLFRWKPELADRKVACKCGHKFRVPSTDPSAEQFGVSLKPSEKDQALRALRDAGENAGPIEMSSGAYAAGALGNLASSEGNTTGKCIACNSPLKPGAVICVNCGVNQATGQKLRAKIESLLPGERAEPAKTVRGLEFVRAGLWAVLGSLILAALLFLAVIGAGISALPLPVMQDVLTFLADYGGYAVSALQLIGAALCLLGPKEAGGRILLAISIVLSIASAGLDTYVLAVPQASVLTILLLGLGSTVLIIGSTLGFLMYLRTLADFLEFQEIVEQADKVMYIYLIQLVANLLLFVPIISSVIAFVVLGLVVYGLILYVNLLIDLTRSTQYRLNETRATV
jgi:hypothetical protein